MECLLEHCSLNRHGRSDWCKKHYNRFRRTGDPNGRIIKSLEERFWEKVDITPYCWLWTKAKSKKGYGKFQLNGCQWAHRVSWFLYYGSWPNEILDHLCRNPSCVNPIHLEDTDRKTNAVRGLNSFSFTGYCMSGRHDMSIESNLTHLTDGSRKCRVCDVERKARWGKAKRQKD